MSNSTSDTDTDALPSRIDNPTSTLPESIDAATVESATTDGLVTAQSVSGFTTITEIRTLEQSDSNAGAVTIFTSTVEEVITNSAEYASLVAAATFDKSGSGSSSLPTSRTSTAPSSEPTVLQSHGITPGAQAGIVIGVISIIVFLATFTFFFVRSRRRRRPKVATTPAEPSQSYMKPELEGSPGFMRFEGTCKPELSATASEVVYAELDPSTGQNKSTYEKDLPSPPRCLVDNVDRNETGKQVTPAEMHRHPLPQPTQTPTQNNINSSTSISYPTSGPQSEEAVPKYFVSHGDHRSSQVVHSSVPPLPVSIMPRGSSDTDGVEEVTITRLKAEHAALAERIRLVEMKELERQGQRVPGRYSEM